MQQHTEHNFTKERHGPVGAGADERHRNDQRAETSLQEEKLRDLRLLRLEKKRLLGDLIVAFST